ncbi:MAG: tetratricopeptide repeat protein [Gammaproteobacteria bacterium]|nr:tetratricopeptide repeat protein [Gammaproteobacteria bacterium]
MRIPQRLLLAGTLLGLAGCAATPQAPQAAVAQTAEEPVEEATENLPRVEMGPNLFFKLLVAEFAAEQGQMHLAADAYLKSAEETGDPRLARRATQAAVYARNSAMALAAAELWVELEPEQIDARQSLAALYIRSGQSDKALPHLEKIIAFSPVGKPGHGYQLVANLLANAKDPQQALQQMTQLTAAHPDDPEALYAHAQLASRLDHNEKAMDLLQRLLTQQPERTDALILQARLLHTSGQQRQALKRLQQVLKQDPDNDAIRLTYARMLVDAQELTAARREFRRLNRRLPENTDVIYALGLLALEAEELDAAEPYFMDLVRLGSRDEEARIALGQIAQMRGNRREAIDWFQSMPKGERYIEAQLLAAQLMAEEYGTDSALEYLRQLSLETESEHTQRYIAEAELLADAERHEEAMAVYNEALESSSEKTTLLYARALTAEKFGRIDLLERDLKQILNIDPNNVQALNALGYTLADRTERYAEAMRYIEQAYALQPEDAAILDSMGWGLYRLGRHQEALEYLRRAAEQLPRDAEVAAHLGEVLWVTGQQQKARQIWERALEVAPEHKVLNETVKRFNP